MNQFKKEYGIKNVFFDNDELLNSDIDTAYITLPEIQIIARNKSGIIFPEDNI